MPVTGAGLTDEQLRSFLPDCDYVSMTVCRSAVTQKKAPSQKSIQGNERSSRSACRCWLIADDDWRLR
jgi:hypothetical protein